MASKTFWKVFDKIKNLAWYSALTFSDSDAQTLLIKELVNDKIKNTSTIVKWYIYNTDYTDTTVANQQEYSMPSWLDKINYIAIQVSWVDYFPKKIWLTEFNKIRNTSTETTSDVPVYYVIETNQIKIYPTPASSWNTITINWNPIASNLNTSAGSTDQNTSIAIKEWYEELIEYAVLADLFRQREDLNQASSYESKYQEKLSQYKNEMRKKTSWIITKFSHRDNFVNPNLISELTIS